MSEKTKSAIDPTAGQDWMTDLMKEMQASGFDSAARFSASWAEAMTEIGQEVLDFVSERVKEDMATQRALLSANSVSEFQKVQADFLRTAIEQYSQETSKLVQMGTDILPRIPGVVVTPD